MSAPVSRGAALGALAVLLGLPAAWAVGMAASGRLPLTVLPAAGAVVLALGLLAARRIGRVPERVRRQAATGALLGALAVAAVVVFPAVLPTVGMGGAVALAAERPEAVSGSAGTVPRPAGRGGARHRAGRPRVGPATVAAAVVELQRSLAEIIRAGDHPDRPRAEALARRLWRDTMRLRRRLLAVKSQARRVATVVERGSQAQSTAYENVRFKQVKPLAVREVRGNRRAKVRTRLVRDLMNVGLSTLEYHEMLNEQNGVCAICQRPRDNTGRRLCVDHDHVTGQVRGLLCSTCNWQLGRHGAKFADPARARRAKEYLEHSDDAES